MNKMQYLDLIQPAIELVVKKHEDYNDGLELKSYFPFGDVSYTQMLHVKSQRLVSLAGKSLNENNAAPHYESVKDTVLDMINYCVFYLDYLKGVQDAQPL